MTGERKPFSAHSSQQRGAGMVGEAEAQVGGSRRGSGNGSKGSSRDGSQVGGAKAAGALAQALGRCIKI